MGDLAINKAQHGMGGAWPCFAWRVLDSGSAWLGRSPAMLRLEGAGFWLSMAWVEPGHASLGGCWHVAQIAPTPGHVTSQLPFSSPAEALLGAGSSPGWARERFSW